MAKSGGMMRKFYLILLLLIVNSMAYGSISTWVLDYPSAQINGMGEIGTCLPSDDPNSVYYNPANGLAAYDGVSANFGYQNYPNRMYFGTKEDLSFYFVGINIIPQQYPFKLVLGSHYYKKDQKMNTWDQYGNEQYNIDENSLLAATISFGYENRKIIPMNFALGLTRKTIDQTMSSDKDFIIEKSIYDVGFLASFPYQSKSIENFPYFGVHLEPAVGFSVLNIGDFYEPKYSNISKMHMRKFTYPRYGSLGLSLSGKILYKNYFEIFSFQIGREVGDLLTTTESKYVDDSYYIGEEKYIPFFKDIDIGDDFILGNSNKSDVKSGMSFRFFDLINVGYGKINSNIHTSGMGVESHGINRFLYLLSGNPIFTKINRFVDVSYYHSVKSIHYEMFSAIMTNNTILINFKNLINENLDNHKYKSILEPSSDFNLIFGTNLSYFRSFLQNGFKRKFTPGFNVGVEKEFKYLLVDLLYNYNRNKLSESRAYDADMSYKILKHSLSTSLLLPIRLSDNFQFSGGFAISSSINGEVRRKIKNDYGKDYKNTYEIKNKPEYGIVLNFDMKIISDTKLRFNYNRSLGEIDIQQLNNFQHNSFGINILYTVRN